MPFASEKQRRAMYAAASGESKSGIPRKVAKKYIADSKDNPVKRHTAKPSKRRKGY